MVSGFWGDGGCMGRTRSRRKYISVKKLRAEAAKLLEEIPFVKKLCKTGTTDATPEETRETFLELLAGGIAAAYKFSRGYRIPKRYMP